MSHVAIEDFYNICLKVTKMFEGLCSSQRDKESMLFESGVKGVTICHVNIKARFSFPCYCFSWET